MSVIVVIKLCRGRAVTNVGRTCGPTPLPWNNAIKYVYTMCTCVICSLREAYIFLCVRVASRLGLVLMWAVVGTLESCIGQMISRCSFASYICILTSFCAHFAMSEMLLICVKTFGDQLCYKTMLEKWITLQGRQPCPSPHPILKDIYSKRKKNSPRLAYNFFFFFFGVLPFKNIYVMLWNWIHKSTIVPSKSFVVMLMEKTI